MFHSPCQAPTGFEFPQLQLYFGTDWFYQQTSNPQNEMIPTTTLDTIIFMMQIYKK